MNVANPSHCCGFFFFFNDTATTEIYTLSLHDALPISCSPPSRRPVRYVVGIDIGGTNIVAGTVPEDGSELVGLVSEPTFPEQGAGAVVARIVKLARASVEIGRASCRGRV